MAPDGAADSSGDHERDSYLDLLRVFAIAAVVVGHWLVTGIAYSNGHFDGVDVLAVVNWTSWLTLPLQVIPLFFFVGGYVNSLSWSRYGTGSWWRLSPGWVRRRTMRLLVPTSGYVVVMVLAVLACDVAGVDKGDLSQAAWASALHLWFLAAYAIVLLPTPALYAAHRRWGFAVPVAMAALAAVINVATIEWHWHLIGWANYVLVWGTFHQLGFAWRDGTLTGRRWAGAALAGGAIVALVGLIWWGPYPISMVGVPGARIQNASPPSIALLAFGVAQAGLAVLLAPLATRWLAGPARRRRRVVVSKAAALSMPIYLWHMAPLVIVTITVYPSGLFSQPAIGSGAWWWQRIAWVALLAVVLAAVLWLLTLTRPLLRRYGRSPQAPLAGVVWRPLSAAVLVAGIALAATGLGRMAVAGFAPTGYLDAFSLTTFAVGLVVITHQPGSPRWVASVWFRPNRPPSHPRRETARQLPTPRRAAGSPATRATDAAAPGAGAGPRRTPTA
jgi:fucose 4-O-acetylase-like acetyltransferase